MAMGMKSEIIVDTAIQIVNDEERTEGRNEVCMKDKPLGHDI